MRSKVVKAYSTAWRWPEVYSESPAIIWTSRIISIVIPLILIGLTFLTGVPLFGWGITALIATFVAAGLIVVMVKTFYVEFESVEDHETRQNRIKEFFHGFPSLTPVPLIEYEPGAWVAYGHVPPQEFIEAIQTVILHVTEDQALADRFAALEPSVGHLYACFTEEDHWSAGLNLCKPSERESFPITRIEL